MQSISTTIMFRKIIPIVQCTLQRSSPIGCQVRNIAGGVYEPDYLDSLQPKFPQYEKLNVQIKGYDYPILENYQRFLHGVAEYLEIDVSDCFALPPQQTQVQRLRPNSTVVEADYKLTMYERNLQINHVNAPIYPQFLRIAQQALPEGVQLSIENYTDECEERRYVPDKDLLDLKAELEQMQTGGQPAKKK